MDIRVGIASPVGSPADKAAKGQDTLEARILAVREPRRRGGHAPAAGEERREGSADRDPLNGRVLVLLIPDGGRLPAGLESGAYRVFLRFARR
jgi:hypothetical protein